MYPNPVMKCFFSHGADLGSQFFQDHHWLSSVSCFHSKKNHKLLISVRRRGAVSHLSPWGNTEWQETVRAESKAADRRHVHDERTWQPKTNWNVCMCVLFRGNVVRPRLHPSLSWEQESEVTGPITDWPWVLLPAEVHQKLAGFKSEMSLDYKITLHIFMWNMQQADQRAQRGVYGNAVGPCVSARPCPHPAFRANGLYVSVLKMDISMCSWHQCGHVQRHLRVHVDSTLWQDFLFSPAGWIQIVSVFVSLNS